MQPTARASILSALTTRLLLISGKTQRHASAALDHIEKVLCIPTCPPSPWGLRPLSPFLRQWQGSIACRASGICRRPSEKNSWNTKVTSGIKFWAMKARTSFPFCSWCTMDSHWLTRLVKNIGLQLMTKSLAMVLTSRAGYPARGYNAYATGKLTFENQIRRLW